MGRAHEVRAASMAATAAKKGALYMQASKEIYMAAKSGEPDPNSNLALRSAIEKWKSQQVTRDVIERAIQKAKGGSQESYHEGRYEGYGVGQSCFIIDTLTDNDNRALVNTRTAVTKRGGHLGTPGSVSFNFTQSGVLSFKADQSRDEIEEMLIMSDVDVTEVSKDEEGYVDVLVTPTALNDAKKVLNDAGIAEFETAEIQMIANELIVLSPEEKEKFQHMLDDLDEVEDVQAVWHNVDLSK